MVPAKNNMYNTAPSGRNHHMKHLPGAVLLITILIFSACSFDYGEKEEGQAQAVPTYVLTHTTYEIARKNGLKIVFDAETCAVWQSTQTADLSGVTFRQFDEQGELSFEGACDTATINMQNQDSTLEGNIIIRVLERDFVIKAQGLMWDHDTENLTAPETDTVYLSYDQGSTISGTGFTGNLLYQTFSFESASRGVLLYEHAEQ